MDAETHQPSLKAQIWSTKQLSGVFVKGHESSVRKSKLPADKGRGILLRKRKPRSEKICLVNCLTHDESVKNHRASRGSYKTQTHDLAPNSVSEPAEEEKPPSGKYCPSNTLTCGKLSVGCQRAATQTLEILVPSAGTCSSASSRWWTTIYCRTDYGQITVSCDGRWG